MHLIPPLLGATANFSLATRCCSLELLDPSPAGGMDEHGMRATLGLLHASTGRSISYMGHTEFQDLARPSDWASLQILGEGLPPSPHLAPYHFTISDIACIFISIV